MLASVLVSGGVFLAATSPAWSTTTVAPLLGEPLTVGAGSDGIPLIANQLEDAVLLGSDGSRVFFRATGASATQFVASEWVVNSDGSGLTNLDVAQNRLGSANRAVASHDGRLVASRLDGRVPSVAVVDTISRTRRVLTFHGKALWRARSGSISAHDDQILPGADGGFYVASSAYGILHVAPDAQALEAVPISTNGGTPTIVRTTRPVSGVPPDQVPSPAGASGGGPAPAASASSGLGVCRGHFVYNNHGPPDAFALLDQKQNVLRYRTLTSWLAGDCVVSDDGSTIAAPIAVRNQHNVLGGPRTLLALRHGRQLRVPVGPYYHLAAISPSGRFVVALRRLVDGFVKTRLATPMLIDLDKRRSRVLTLPGNATVATNRKFDYAGRPQVRWTSDERFVVFNIANTLLAASTAGGHSWKLDVPAQPPGSVVAYQNAQYVSRDQTCVSTMASTYLRTGQFQQELYCTPINGRPGAQLVVPPGVAAVNTFARSADGSTALLGLDRPQPPTFMLIGHGADPVAEPWTLPTGAT